ncbi:MAG: glycosyltransferase [Acidobacteria bacterium]|nr:glycosyltransferase [Acidobacteriota bacterium]MCA1643578.1 glycosyltransferase [Acidobacteriota bacterium]
MIKGLVSVIIPTYNRADYVVEAVRSAQAQTYPLKQIIVVDDGSCDDTARRVAGIGGVEYCHQENRGQGAARNRGLRLARGEYVASLDSDDLWDEDFLARSVECLEAFGLDFVFTNWVKVRGGETQVSEWLRDGKWRSYMTDRRGEWSLLTPPQVRKLFLALCPAPSSSLLLRRDSIVSGWGEHMRIADDWYLILEMALNRPCRAAFSLTPRWKKRADGMNVYDGRSFAEIGRNLHLHDYPTFRRDFRPLLSRREKLTLSRREAMYRLRLLLHEAVNTDLAARVQIPFIIARLRNLGRHS